VAIPTEGAGKGSRIDLGTALIASGFAFAALTLDGRPVHPPYLEAERVAQNTRAGLWAFQDLPNPNAIILHALRPGASLSPDVQPPP
jgi:endonuclease YncB( thermonuclease family)